MTTVFEKLKSSLRNQKVYKKLKENPILQQINQHYKDNAQEMKKAAVHSYGLESLKLAKESFAETQLEFWLDYGTLLGAVREKDFIGHDFDIDLATFFTNNEDAKKFENAMVQRGFNKSREFRMDGKLVEETYLYKGVNLDVFYYYVSGEKEKINGFVLEEGENTVYKEEKEQTLITGLKVQKVTSTFSGIKWIDFKGEQMPIPESFDQYLKDNYGPTYMIKDENWVWAEEDKCTLPFKDNTRAILFK